MSTLDEQLGSWPMQRAQRAELDDDLEVPRPVDHFASFSRRAHADAAAAELGAAGYTVTIARKGLRSVLEATREESLEDESVAGFLDHAISIIERHRGSYDGWGASVAE